MYVEIWLKTILDLEFRFISEQWIKELIK